MTTPTHKLVPVDPTEAMISAADALDTFPLGSSTPSQCADSETKYRAMLAAAPAPPDAGEDKAELIETRDDTATRVLGLLAEHLGVREWSIHDGTDDWAGDVAATIAHIIEISARPQRDAVIEAAAYERAAKACDQVAANAERRYAVYSSYDAKARDAALDKMEAAQLCADACRALKSHPSPPAQDERGVIAAEIAAERTRQINREGFDASHDDEHDNGELALAAACYAAVSPSDDRLHDVQIAFYDGLPPEFAFKGWLRWPWDREWWKPKDRRRDLIRAAALIVAEIERLDRASAGDHLPAKAEG